MATEQIAEQIFKIVKGFGHNIVLFTEDGKKTVDPEQARRFYIKDIKVMINFEVSDSKSEIIINLSKDVVIDEIKPLITSLRNLANRYIVEFTVKTYGKSISPKDFAYQARTVKESEMNEQCEFCDATKNVDECPQCGGDYGKLEETETDNSNSGRVLGQGMSKSARSNDIAQSDSEYIMQRQLKRKWAAKYPSKKFPGYTQARAALKEGFSGWHGSARKSMNELGDARLVVRHKRSVDETKRGARTRQIESIFVENAEGERFKFPSKNLTAAKAMLRHVQEGGAPHDDFGQHIYECMAELDHLKKFNRKNKRNNFFEDVAITEEIGLRIESIRKNLKQMSGPKGYNHHYENFTKEQHNVAPEKLDELKDNVTIRYFDESIADSLPYVAKIIEGFRTRKEKEKEIMDFAKLVMNMGDNITISSSIDDDDPENPANRQFKDPAAKISAMVTYLAPKIKDDELANKMMQLSDTVFEVGNAHIKIALTALNVIGQKAIVSEVNTIGSEKNAIDLEEMEKITEAFDKYNVQKIFGV